MSKRLVISIILVNLILISNLTIESLADDQIWWNPDWSFSQEIQIPINTSQKGVKFQPIDIPIEFEEPCWAKNENEHSIRVVFQNEENLIELESQIYDLKFEDKEHIKACNLVFLIPEEANGREKYYVYYDDEVKPDPNYEKHLAIEESSYSIEPVPGFPFKSRYIAINEKGQFIYAASLEGEFMGSGVSQQLTKLKLGSQEVIPKNGEQLLSLDLYYWYYKNNEWILSSTGSRFVSKERIVEGNLMVKFGIASKSSDGLFQTTAIYKYYYCPTNDKRIYAHVKHELMKYPLPPNDAFSLFFATLRSGGIKSNTIEELNFGSIPPYLHVYGEDERILTYNLNPYPEDGWAVIGKKDDVDLGSKAWASFDEGETGKTHAIILDSTNILESGVEERDGVQIRANELKDTELQLPGLEARFANIYLGRNEYETDEEEDTEIPRDYIISFDAEFFTTETGGYKAVDEEASIFQSLIKYQPPSDNNVTNGEEEREKYSLTTYVHFAPSFLLGSALSTLLNTNFSYISVELYKDSSFISSGTASRLPLVENMDLNFEGKKLREKIKMVIALADWKNFSFFKKARFSDLEAGRYLIKIYRENPLFRKERQFIGYSIIELEKDTTIRIFCRPEGKITMSILNQHKTGIQNAEIYIIKDDMIIANSQSESDGTTVIGMPCSFRDKYSLNVVYKGFLVHQEQIQVGFIRCIIPLEKIVSFEVHNLTINITKANGNPPDYDVNMILTSDKMAYPTEIPAEKTNNGTYIFTNLYPSDYTLRIRYKSFDIEETVNIPSISSFTINLYDLNVKLADKWGLPPESSFNLIITSDEFKKTVVIPGEKISEGKYLFSDLYLGDYALKLFYKSYVLEKPVSIPYKNNATYELVFPFLYNVTITALDARGNIKQSGKVVLIRGGQEVFEDIIDDEGETFYVPPGDYNVRIYSDDTLVAQRKIDVTDEITYTIVTSEEPLLPLIIIGLAGLILIGFVSLNYKKRALSIFAKTLVFSLIIIALVLPWWTLSGSSSVPQVETSTNMFLIPPGLITITSTEDVIAGEVILSNSEFLFVMSIVVGLTVIGCICIVVNILLKLYTKKSRLMLISLVLGTALFVCSIFIFFIGMSQVTEAGVGSIIGSSNLDISIPGEGAYEKLSCNWGPNVGFYLYILAAFSGLILSFFRIKEIFLEKRMKN